MNGVERPLRCGEGASNALSEIFGGICDHGHDNFRIDRHDESLPGVINITKCSFFRSHEADRTPSPPPPPPTKKPRGSKAYPAAAEWVVGLHRKKVDAATAHSIGTGSSSALSYHKGAMAADEITSPGLDALQRWQMQASIGGKRKFLGYFADEIEPEELCARQKTPLAATIMAKLNCIFKDS